MNESLNKLINAYSEAFTGTEHILLFSVNIILFLFAKNMVKFFEKEEETIKFKTNVIRFFNGLFLLLHIIDIFLHNFFVDYENILFKIITTGIIIYISYFIHLIAIHVNKKMYGKIVEIDGKKVLVDTYSSKMTDIIVDIIVTFMVIIILIKFWEFNSMLETTGIIGLILGFFALTSSIWAPDILHGLILLNNNLYTEGDIIEFEEDKYVVYKLGNSRATLFNLDNNARTTIKNSTLSEKHIFNLTKFASTTGLRQSFIYKIGYPDYIFNEKNKEKRLELYTEFKRNLEDTFKYAYDKCVEDNNIEISTKNEGFEVFMINAGDYAIEYEVVFFVKIPNSITKKTTNPLTASTASIARKYLNDKYLVNERILESSFLHGVNLSTPELQKSEYSILKKEMERTI